VVLNFFPETVFKTEFTPAVDNPRGVLDIQNYLTSPLLTGEGTSNGVIQFFNHKSKTIDKFTVQKVQAWSKLFGGLVNNIEAKTVKLTTTLALDMTIEPVLKSMDASFHAVVKDGNYNVFMNLIKPLELIKSESKKDIDPEMNLESKENKEEQARIISECKNNN